MKEGMKPGVSAESSLTVDGGNTASALGSGDMDVFATPAMVALAENAAMKAAAPFLESGETTVGGFVSMAHSKPTAPGDTVTARATLTAVEGRKLTFTVEARDTSGPIGNGEHIRFVVSRDRFLSKLK